jgi:DUF4097 and DUF4098 domain-containing protein YvlB
VKTLFAWWLAGALPIPSVAAPTPGAIVESAAKDARISVEVVGLDIEIRTWVHGKIEASTDALGFVPVISGTRRRLRVELDGVGLPMTGTLVLRVPQHAELRIETVNGDVAVHDLRGEAEIVTVSGRVAVDGQAERLEIVAVDGRVDVTGAPERVEVSTVSGAVTIAGAREEVEAESISGAITLRDVALGRLELTSVTGAIAVAGTFGDGPLRIDTHGGAIDLAVPSRGPLEIVVDTFSGEIVDRFDAPEVRVRGTHRRALGRGGPTLRINSFSGAVTIGPPRAPK